MQQKKHKGNRLRLAPLFLAASAAISKKMDDPCAFLCQLDRNTEGQAPPCFLLTGTQYDEAPAVHPSGRCGRGVWLTKMKKFLTSLFIYIFRHFFETQSRFTLLSCWNFLFHCFFLLLLLIGCLDYFFSKGLTS